jgi:hypothetical protein
VEKFVKDRTQPWAVFQVPENAAPLTGLDAKLAGNVVTICNHGKTNGVRSLCKLMMAIWPLLTVFKSAIAGS